MLGFVGRTLGMKRWDEELGRESLGKCAYKM
jgi:hypothetical protein